MDKIELEVLILRKGTSIAALAESIGIDKTTMYRKLANGKFERSEIMKIRDALCMTDADVIRIFFSDDSCVNATNEEQ